MKTTYENDRIINLEEITARYKFREIEGCTHWRHFAVHQDRAWLLNAIDKIRGQVEKIRQATDKPGEQQAVEAEVRELLAMFEEATLNHLGDKDE